MQTIQPDPQLEVTNDQVENCIEHDPGRVYSIIVSQGFPRESALQLTGSFMQESRLNPCQQYGDSGLAWGLNSWHPNRRQDMPFDLTEQIAWALQTELPRDCRSCYDQLLAGGDRWSMREAIYKWTRWGELGKRWIYADEYAAKY